MDGRWLVSWCGNDYLGLSTDPRVIQAGADAAGRWGIGARASRLLAGSTVLHAQLEDDLASFFHAESAVTFASGYLANLGALSSLLGPDGLVVVDRLAHASLIDACRASRATLRVFHHNDAAHLDDVLGRHDGAARRIVVTEGVFSMEGDRAPLRALLEVAERHDALVYLDDAHGAFVEGRTGRGSPEAAGIEHARVIYMGTLGKALGCQGGFIAGPRALTAWLQNRARTFIYSTAPAVPVIGAAIEALRIVREDPAPRQRLARSVQHAHRLLKHHGDLAARQPSHIIPMIVGESSRATRLADELAERGMLALAVRPPTVPEGAARLRISLSALHTEEQISQLVEALRDATG